MFQKESALASRGSLEARTANGPRGVRKTMIVALARKLSTCGASSRTGPCWSASSCSTQGVSRNIEHRVSTETGFPRSLLKRSFFFPRRARIRSKAGNDLRRRRPAPNHGLRAEERMVPPPRNYAADAHASWVRGRKARRIQGCGAMIGCPRHSSPSRFSPSPNRWPLRGPRTSSSSANPHERRASSSVENSPESERARMPMCASTKALACRRAAAFVPHARGRGERSSERWAQSRPTDLGHRSSSLARPLCAGLRPPPPAASALTRVRPSTFCAAKVSTGRSGASKWTPDAPPGARHHANFPLDKKDLIQGRARGLGDWPQLFNPAANPSEATRRE